MKTSAVVFTILSDNRSLPPFKSEHGFSVLVTATSEAGESHTVLFDTGRDILLYNDHLLSTDPDYTGVKAASYLVLSHGHYDHTDALAEVIDTVPGIGICASRCITKRHFSMSTGSVRDRSLSSRSRGSLGHLASERRFFFTDQLSLFTSSVSSSFGLINLAGNIPRVHPLETPAPLLFADKRCLVADTVPDEIVLWLESERGLIILTGCAHAGFINTCEYIKEISGCTSLYAVLGGFHLSGCGQTRLDAICDYIRMQNIQMIVPCHCTGDTEGQFLEKELGTTRVNRGYAGKKISL